MAFQKMTQEQLHLKLLIGQNSLVSERSEPVIHLILNSLAEKLKNRGPQISGPVFFSLVQGLNQF